MGSNTGRDHRRHHGRPPVTRIVGISGSLRERSYNRALLQAARELAPDGVEIEEFDLAAIPLYNPDVEAAGDPQPVAALRDAVRNADGLLFATPEYNRGTSGVLKNAIDWLSRPAMASVLRWKPTAVIGASTGRGGTRRAQQQVRDALLFPGAIVLDEPEVAVPLAWEHFDEDGRLVDERTRESIRALLEGLATAPRARESAEAA
jgi:chromate reductase